MACLHRHHLVPHSCLTSPSRDRSSAVNVSLRAPCKMMLTINMASQSTQGRTKNACTHSLYCIVAFEAVSDIQWCCKGLLTLSLEVRWSGPGLLKTSLYSCQLYKTSPFPIECSLLTRYRSFEVTQPANLLVHPISGIPSNPPSSRQAAH